MNQRLIRTSLLGIVALLATSIGCDSPNEPGPADPSWPDFQAQDGATPSADAVASDGVSSDPVQPGPGDPGDPIDPKPDPDDHCVSNKEFFVEKIWTPILSTDCIVCHNKLGAAAASKFVLADSYQTGFLDTNLETFAQMAEYSKNGVPTLLIKPLGGDGHGGGMRFGDGSDSHIFMQMMVERIKNPPNCSENASASTLKGVEVLDWESTLRKARMTLTSQLPTQEEVAAAQGKGEAGLDMALDTLMTEPNFFRWLKEVYNEVFFTDAYQDGTAAVDLLGNKDFPQRKWYETCDTNVVPNCAIEEFKEKALKYTNWSISQDTLELVVHVVRNDLPFTEILTADYMMVNPYSAKSYGANNIFFNNPLDPLEFRPAKIVLAGGESGQPVTYPHAGVLTSPMWLNRFPTTDTNVNRHRARMVYSQFLATDVLKLAERAVDQSTIQMHNPTMNELACAACHVIVDPVAGAFQNWNNSGRYRPPMEGWFAEMRPPGFGEETIGPEDSLSSLQWLATRLAYDHRFVTATIHTIFKALTGIAPLSPPTDTADPDYALKLTVYLQQDEYFKVIGDAFIADDYNLKTVIKMLIKGPYFRAKQGQENLGDDGKDPNFSQEAFQITLGQLGTSRLLTPEELDRKITTITGIEWVDPDTGLPTLLHKYRLYYGGIDFSKTSERITEMNGTMANIAERMANEVSCLSVPTDFLRDPESRQLFPFVEFDYAPKEKHGFLVPEMEQMIKNNILFLHERLLNEVLTTDSEEFQRTYDLYLKVLDKGRQMIKDGLASPNLPMPCHATIDPLTGEPMEEGMMTEDPEYTVRTWMAIVSYLLSDYRFLYQ